MMAAAPPAPSRRDAQLLRFLYLQAMITAPLREGVPPVPGWKDTAVTRRLATAEVQALLASCDRAT
jgi:hypothetical protein